MTKDSGIHGIPLPADAVDGTGPAIGVQVTSVGTLAEVAAFYHDYLTTHGWTLNSAFTEVDPAVARGISLGILSDRVYCKPTTPIATVGVIVGILDTGPKVEIGLVDITSEDSCP